MKKLIVSFVSVMVLFSTVYAATTCDEVATVNTSIESLNTTVTNQQALVSKLSDDIGIMSDRILVMADKIVATEQLLADTLLAITGTTTSASTGVVLSKPLDGSTQSKTVAPTMELSTASTTYLLYASTEPTFSAGNTISLYIESTESLSTSWTQVVNFAGTSTTIYIAVKSVDSNGKISSLSNGVKITLQ
ncbi:hypothetical protein JHD47_06210 [Sulfurimonas sp. SAG-AH-194-L11]|nr:hypothetical protein [Sulfurimonas sp. SAG-AH-194-L11]MDF1877407.1 hypothetical protein [Sulfurimonas sp. SAG-AH-194-L11]